MTNKQGVDRLELSLEHGIDLEHRRLFLMSDIEENVTSKVIQGLLKLGTDSAAPVELYVSTFGGSLYEMFGIYDAITTADAPVYVNAIGKCMSAGILVVAAGAKGHRHAYANTWFMTHQGWGDQVGSVTELASATDHFKEIMKLQYSLLEKHTSRDAKYWKKLLEQPKDIYFNAKTALDYGLIDAIWEPNK
jgi:ATP-dependent Clp protease, protease subunit